MRFFRNAAAIAGVCIFSSIPAYAESPKDSTDTLFLFVYIGVGALLFFIYLGVLARHQRMSYQKSLGGASRGWGPQSAPEGMSDKMTDVVRKMVDHEVETARRKAAEEFRGAIQEKEKEIQVVRRDCQMAQQKYTEAQQAVKKISAEKKQTEAVVRSLGEGVVVVNKKGEVMMMNPSAEKLLGAKKEKKIGQPVLEGLGKEYMVSLSKTARGPQEDQQIIEFQTQDENTRKILQSSNAVIQDEEGETVGMVSVLTDVTKQRELEELKKRFVSNVTHELRTPVVAMQNAMEIVMSPDTGALNETQSKFLSIVSRNLAQLSFLVEDVLDLAKMESGKEIIKPVRAKLDKVLNESCDLLETWAKSKGLKIVRDIDASLPEMPLDPQKIQQVMNNLMSNAIKFTPSGGIVTVRASLDSSRAKAQISVADTGMGIAKENIPRLFQRFEQFGDLKGSVGTGLGLSIAKEIIQKHGGEISVESEEKKGTKFTFTLPVKS